MPGLRPATSTKIVLGHFNGGFLAQDFNAAPVLQASPDFRFKPAARVENACATGSAAVHQGLKAIAARSARIVLVVGVEQMTTRDRHHPAQGFLPAGGRRHAGGLRRRLRQDRQNYFQRHGDQSHALAAIAAKNHTNGVNNPYAQMRKDLGYDFCPTESDKTSYVAGPLKRTDCSLVSDGAAVPPPPTTSRSSNGSGKADLTTLRAVTRPNSASIKTPVAGPGCTCRALAARFLPEY